jgi:hypothetical protein
MIYKAPDNSLHFLDDDSFAHLLPAGSVQITDAEVSTILAANAPKPTVKDQIAILESTITPRRIREATLGIDNGWLKGINDKINEFRSKLT